MSLQGGRINVMVNGTRMTQIRRITTDIFWCCPPPGWSSRTWCGNSNPFHRCVSVPGPNPKWFFSPWNSVSSVVTTQLTSEQGLLITYHSPLTTNSMSSVVITQSTSRQGLLITDHSPLTTKFMSSVVNKKRSRLRKPTQPYVWANAAVCVRRCSRMCILWLEVREVSVRRGELEVKANTIHGATIPAINRNPSRDVACRVSVNSSP